MISFSSTGQPHPLFHYLDISVMKDAFYSKCIKHSFDQGKLVDCSFVSGGGKAVNCHRVMAASLSPFLLSLFRESEICDQIILPDFSINAICHLMNFIYTGM